MSEREAVRSFLEGRLGPWALTRRMIRAGISAGAALALVAGLPAVARGECSFDELAARSRRLCQPDLREQRRLERLLRRVGDALGVAVRADSLDPLAVGLARFALNVDAPVDQPVSVNVDTRAGRLPLKLSGIVLNLGNDQELRNSNVSIGGLIGNLPVNLSGTVEAPLGNAQGRNLNLGNVNLNFTGNAGNVPLNFLGNVGNITRNDPDQR